MLQAKRTKEILSANSDAPISVEELHDGCDFRSRITRWDTHKIAVFVAILMSTGATSNGEEGKNHLRAGKNCGNADGLRGICIWQTGADVVFSHYQY